MTVYITFVPILVLQVYVISYLYRARRDDRVIFRFSTFQSNTIAFLNSPSGKELSSRDYNFTRWLLEMSALTTQQFDIVKNSFNISHTLRSLRFFDNQVVTPADRLHNIENKQVHELYHQFITDTVEAFVAYTPFLKSKFVLRFFMAAAGLLANMGVKKVHLWTKELLDRWASLRKENDYCFVA